MWVIYERPADYPQGYVLRPQLASRYGVSVAPERQVASTVEEVRALLPPGLVCLGRQEQDDPSILEVWI